MYFLHLQFTTCKIYDRNKVFRVTQKKIESESVRIIFLISNPGYEGIEKRVEFLIQKEKAVVVESSCMRWMDILTDDPATIELV